MSNFSVNTTEILGTDSMNNSRVTINNNFKSLEDTVNNIGEFFPANNKIGGENIEITANTITTKNINISTNAKIGTKVTITNNGVQIGDYTLDEDTLKKLIDLIS